MAVSLLVAAGVKQGSDEGGDEPQDVVGVGVLEDGMCSQCGGVALTGEALADRNTETVLARSAYRFFDSG